MRSTRDYLSTSALTAVFALAMPLYANADLLPPPSDLGKSMGEFSGAGEYSMVLPTSGNLNQTGAAQGAKNGMSGKGPGSMSGGGFGAMNSMSGGGFGAMNSMSGGGSGSGKGFGSVASVGSGSPVKNESVINGGSGNGGRVNNSPILGGLGDSLVTTPNGAGASQPFVMRDGNKPKPSFTPGRIGSRDVRTGSLTDSLFGGEGGLIPSNGQQGEKVSVDDRLLAWAEAKIHDNQSTDIQSDTTQPDWIRSLDLGVTNNPKDLEQVLITNLVAPNLQLVAIPEPGTLLLLCAGLLLLRHMRRRIALAAPVENPRHEYMSG